MVIALVEALALAAAAGLAGAAFLARRARPVPVALVVDRNGKVREVPLDGDDVPGLR
jgi:hypothetical protein